MKTIAAPILSFLTWNLIAAPEIPPPILPEGVGVNIHFTRGHERDLDLIAAAGFKFIRMDFSWGGTERRKGEYDWSAYDELTANLEQRKIRPLYILDYSNGLYEDEIVSRDPISGRERRDVASPQKPESVAAFARWAGAAAAHFKGRGIIWEIWNEPNIGFWKPKPDVQQYIPLVQATTQAVRQADPEAVIVAPASSGFPWAFFAALFAAPGVLEQLDAVSVHPYRGYSRGPETAGEDYLRLRALIERHAPPTKKSMPILSGEWGYATHAKGGVSLETQAAFIARQQLANLWHGVPISIWYDWKNDGTDPNYNEHNFGTVSNNLALKPSYVAVQTLTRQLGGFRIARRFATPGPEEWALLLVNDAGDQKVAAWTTAQPHRLILDLGVRASEVSAVDGQGRPLTIRDQGDALVLDLNSAPQYLTLKKPSRRLTAAAAWNFARPVPVLVEAGGAGTAIPVRVRNPFAEAVRAQVTLSWSQQSNSAVMDLAPGASAERSVSFEPLLRGSERVTADLKVELRGQSPQGSDRVIGASDERLAFIVSNPLKLNLAPTEDGLRLLIENPARSRFEGDALIAGERHPVNLDASADRATLEAPKPASGPITVQLVNKAGRAVTEPLERRFQDLPAMTLKAHLDGDAQVPARASLVQTNVPPGEQRPFAKAWRLDYHFDAGWRFVRCAPSDSRPVVNEVPPQALGLWVYGDHSGNSLRMRVTDSSGQTFQPTGPNLDWTGWRWVEFDLADLGQAGRWGGADDGIVHGALRLDTLVLVDGTRNKTSGTIYFAGATLIHQPETAALRTP